MLQTNVHYVSRQTRPPVVLAPCSWQARASVAGGMDGAGGAATSALKPFPTLLVLQTKSWGRELDEKTTTVVCAYTTLVRAQEHVLSEFKEFAEQHDDNTSGMVKEWDKLKYEIRRWRGERLTADDMYNKAVELHQSTIDSDFHEGRGTLWQVERATLPPAAKSRACASLAPPFPIFVVTREGVAEGIVVSTDSPSLEKAQEAAIAEYAKANPSKSRWAEGADRMEKYKRRVQRYHGEKIEARDRAYVYSRGCQKSPPHGKKPVVVFLAHETLLYPRGTYPRAQDYVTEWDPEKNVAPFARAFDYYDFYMSEEETSDREDEDDEDDENNEEDEDW